MVLLQDEEILVSDPTTSAMRAMRKTAMIHTTAMVMAATAPSSNREEVAQEAVEVRIMEELRSSLLHHRACLLYHKASHISIQTTQWLRSWLCKLWDFLDCLAFHNYLLPERRLHKAFRRMTSLGRMGRLKSGVTTTTTRGSARREVCVLTNME